MSERVNIARVQRRAQNEIAEVGPRAARWIAAVSNAEVLALVEAVEAAQAFKEATLAWRMGFAEPGDVPRRDALLMRLDASLARFDFGDAA